MRQVFLKKFLILVCFMISIGSFAQDFSVGGIDYSISDESGTATVVNGYKCNGDINIPDSVNYLYKKYAVTKIAPGAFLGSSLTSINIPNTVTTIGDRAFWGLSELTKVNLPNSITSIGYETFSGCSSLASITIPNSVTTIGNGAFAHCTSLSSITIPNSVTIIGNDAFHDCSSLSSITIPNSVMTIGNDAFAYCTSLASITIPNSVTAIGNSAFTSCSSLASVEMSNSVTTIGDGAFSLCSSLVSVKMSNSVTAIGNEVFLGCVRLASINMPNGVTAIGDKVFYSCPSLTSITIPNTVKSIGKHAFSCGAKEIYSKMINPIECDCFSPIMYYLSTLYVPKNTKSLYEKLEPWKNFQNIKELDYEVTGIENVYKDDIKIAVNGGNLEVEGAKGEMVEVYRMDGKMIYRGNDTSIPVGKGTYIVRVANHSFKISR